jgi:hypothetical protein
VRLSLFGTPATSRLFVPSPDDRWVWSSRQNVNRQGKLKYSEKTCPSANLSTTNPTSPNLGSNPGRCGGKPATKGLSYGMAKSWHYCSSKLYWSVGFEVLTAVVMKSTVFWDITLCSPLKVNRRFGGTYCIHLQCWSISRAKYKCENRWQAEPWLSRR